MLEDKILNYSQFMVPRCTSVAADVFFLRLRWDNAKENWSKISLQFVTEADLGVSSTCRLLLLEQKIMVTYSRECLIEINETSGR